MQDADYKWFLEKYEDLFKKYGASYLMIKDKAVLGSYLTYADGVNAGLKLSDLGTFIVQKCNGDESAYTNYISSMNFCGC